MRNKVKELKQLLTDSNYTVLFTGAGMSTESGLPDFRSASKGLWNNIDPLTLATLDAMENNKDHFIAFYQQRIKDLKKYFPHRGHEILAKWEKTGNIQSIITQNVDGFHHYAGNKRVSELHGTLRTSHCHKCGERFPIEQFLTENLSCSCGGFIRPSVVLFGEMLPEVALVNSDEEVNKADLLIVLGSSLAVSPANFFPMKAKEKGSNLVIINQEETELDDMADLLINDYKIGELLNELDGLVV